MVFPDNLFHFQEIDDPGKIFFHSDGKLQNQRLGMKPFFHHFNRIEKPGSDPLQLVNKGDLRHAVLIGLTPDRFRLGLHTPDRAKHPDSAVQHP